MSKFWLIAALGFGLVAGFLAAVLLPLPLTIRQLSEQYPFKVIEQTEIARELRRGRHAELAERIEQRLPEYVLALKDPSFLDESPMTNDALWHVKRFYLENNLEIPKEIEPILANLTGEDPLFCPTR